MVNPPRYTIPNKDVCSGTSILFSFEKQIVKYPTQQQIKKLQTNKLARTIQAIFSVQTADWNSKYFPTEIVC